MKCSRLSKLMLGVGLVALSAPGALATVFTNVPEASTYRLVYDLEIPDTSGGWAATPAALLAAYSANNSGTGANTIANGSFSRVGYYLELGGHANPALNGFVYASFDAFSVKALDLGVPNQMKFQQTVSNMNVVSNYGGVTNVTGSANGNIEFWPSNYGQNNDLGIPGASNANFDNGDGGSNTGVGHGSMQIFNGTSTLFGYSAWGTVRDSELGIGNAPGANTDWTFNTSNNDGYSIQRLMVVVDNTPIPGLAAPGTPGLVEGFLPGNVNLLPNPSAPLPSNIELSPVLAYTNGKPPWTDNSTVVYSGQFFDADGIFSFAESIDDKVRLFIDGVLVLNNDTWNVPTGTGILNMGDGLIGDGWHTFELYMSNGGGGAGAVGGNGWSTNFGFGYNPNGVAGANGADFIPLVDPGDGSLLRISTPMPEPMTAGLMAVGLGLLGVRRRRSV